ncbi:MAG: helix-turn-helix domain-containing protein [Saprospiraceae bacterium]|nr:helix-turn-helix domain-containing protein [Saprospiraceae bacterium]
MTHLIPAREPPGSEALALRAIHDSSEKDYEVGRGRALEIRDDLSAADLRTRAAREKKNRVARRMLAIANALGMSRADARAAGMDRQALRDAVVRYNAEGLAGLHDRPTSGRPPALTEAELALLSARIFRGPDPEADGVSSWTLPDLCR